MSSYFTTEVKSIYDTTLRALEDDSNLKFNIAEVGFFKMWWEQAEAEQRDSFRSLLSSRRFEFVGGGYSQPDEAATDGSALIKTMTAGHLWINSTFGPSSLPSVSWSLDPFGQTPTAMSLFSQMGFTDAVIDRIPYSTKSFLTEATSLEFFWQFRDSSPSEKIFTHVLHSYYHFGRNGRLEPDIDRLYWGPQASDHVSSFEINSVQRAAKALHEQMAEQSIGQRHNNVMVLFGKDFSFQNATDEFGKMTPLVNWIQENGLELDPPMRVKYATASEYFEAVREETDDEVFPVLGQENTPTTTKSFIPYIFSDFISSKIFGYWSGFFFSRPALKENARAADALLNAAEAFSAFSPTRPTSENELQHATEVSNLMTHHDALPGTSLTAVTDDLYSTLREGASIAQQILEKTVASLLGVPSTRKSSPALARHGGEFGGEVLDAHSEDEERANFWKALRDADSSGQIVPLALVNSLLREREGEIVELDIPIDLAERVFVVGVGKGEQQVVVSSDNEECTLYISTSAAALSISSLGIQVGGTDNAPIFHEETILHNIQQLPSTAADPCENTFAVEILNFSEATGELCSAADNTASVSYGAYRPIRDDPWIFRPVEKSEPSRIFSRTATHYVNDGPLVNYARQDLVLQNELDDATPMHLGSKLLVTKNSASIYLTHTIGSDSNPISEESEIAVELYSESNESTSSFHADTNGNVGGLQKRTYNNETPLPGNFFPIVRLASTDNQVVMTTHTHAISSLKPGALTLMLHRRLSNGGMFEGGLDFAKDPMQDKAVSISKMIWLTSPPPEHNMQDAWVLQEALEEPIIVLVAQSQSSISSVSAVSTPPPASLRAEITTLPGNPKKIVLRLSHSDPDNETEVQYDDWATSLFNTTITGPVASVEERSLSLMHILHTSSQVCGFDSKTMSLCVEPGKIRTLVVSFSQIIK
ncbi:hypothetical protein TrST_g8490 [Triparma strigata]|uniref:Glycoside hydrolase family 38 central domain-containing protein n=1 Tax=Triparma strigata TaxID=1606541 RepID=A0A9W7AQT8_9STRA|nr:hypothetical protein TrST_g8490 [Triparma strigata]